MFTFSDGLVRPRRPPGVAITKDTIRGMGNAIAVFSDPFERAVNEVVAEPMILMPRRLQGGALLAGDALKVELEVGERRIFHYYIEALASGADPDDSFRRCARRLAAVADAGIGEEFGRDSDLTFGKIQYVINKTEASAYVGHFWDYVGSPVAEIDEKKLEGWFIAPDSPRRRFQGCHCLMDDETTGRAVREYRKYGKNKVIANGRWIEVSWRRLVFLETGDRYSVAWYDKFQAIAAELAGRLDLLPIDFLFCCQPRTGFPD